MLAAAPFGARASRRYCQDSLAEATAGFHEAMCFGRVGKREGPVNYWLQPANDKHRQGAFGKAADHGAFFPGAPRLHHRADETEMIVEQEAERNRRLVL